VAPNEVNERVSCPFARSAFCGGSTRQGQCDATFFLPVTETTGVPGLSLGALVCMREGEIMRYQISGKQIDVGEALQTHVKAELGEVVEKYAQRPTECVVVFSRVAHEFVCEAVIHLSTGLTAQAKGHASEIYAAFESCREKMDKQLRRYKRRIRNHHNHRAGPVEFGGASSYILAATEDAEEAEPESLQPVVIAEMETKIPSITVGEAVMQMELAGQKMLVFRNEGHGGVNVVYRRDDGNIGWIDPRNSR
jgi:ribosomal subunit interface protein